MEHVPVVIIGSGPAGLLLAHLLRRQHIASIVLERRDRTHVESRIRAGVIEQGAVEMFQAAGVAERLEREGLPHKGIHLSHNGRRQHVSFADLIGRNVTVYGQTEITRDMIGARLAHGGEIRFEAEVSLLRGLTGERPRVSYRHNGETAEVACDFIAGCDGFHGVSRKSMPADLLRCYERIYPFAWLGILADVAPPADELIYARHQRGFALYSMRSASRSRHYLQCAPGEDLRQWSDDRIWEELRTRLGDADAHLLADGPLLDSSVTPMRSFVAEPLRHGRLFLAGDAAHIVPPTGAKGLNLAASDIHYLSSALVDFYRDGDETGLAGYSQRALARVWKAIPNLLHFSSPSLLNT